MSNVSSASIARSYLFVPASACERIPKAFASGADVVIVDLEDAVPIGNKVAARSALANFLDAGTAVSVRVNSFGTPWYEDDLLLCRHHSVHSIILPKAESAAQIEQARFLSKSKPVIPLIETAKGIDSLKEISLAVGVKRLAFGSIDFQLDMGIGGDAEELSFFRSTIVLSSKVAGLASPIDGVTTSIDDQELIRNETLRSRRFGFGAKLCIHPKQVSIVNKSLSPSETEVAWAHRVKGAAVGSNGAPTSLDGKMIDKPVILRAEAILRSIGAEDVAELDFSPMFGHF